MDLTIKNMICDRCIKLVRELLSELSLPYISVDLGKIHFKRDLNLTELKTLNRALTAEGFEILEEQELIIVEGVKFAVISEVRGYSKRARESSYAEILTHDFKMSYSKISKLFFQVEGKSIERYIILQNIERAKELMTYGELSMSEIALDLMYSSPQHLSKQFKQVTGFSPTEFKEFTSRENR